MDHFQVTSLTPFDMGVTHQRQEQCRIRRGRAELVNNQHGKGLPQIVRSAE